ncbi:MAG: hypothetical protein IPL49_05890 [Saprospirales bacterium]|nr:hypothetical protein [Saprospirales bacterium]
MTAPSGEAVLVKHKDSYTKAYKKTRNFWQKGLDNITFKNWANIGIGVDALIYRPLSILDYNIGLMYRTTTFQLEETYNTINTLAPNVNITIKTSANPERSSRLAFVVGGEFHYNFRFRQRDELRNILSEEISYLTKSGFAASGGIFWNFTPGAGVLYQGNYTRTATPDAYFNIGISYSRFFYDPFSEDFKIENGTKGYVMDYSVIRIVFMGRGSFEGTWSN